MKKANAELSVEVNVVCPECCASQDILTSRDAIYIPVTAAIFSDSMEDLGIIIRCQECGKEFELNDIDR